MTYLLYYQKERTEFPEEFKTNLNPKIADKIITKLIGHFKIFSHNDWRFTGSKSSHCITWKDTGKGNFKFSKKYTSLGVICHELAHAIEISKRGVSTHAKKHYIIMKRLINYCRNNKYINNLLNKDDMVTVVSGKERQGMSTTALQMGQTIKQLSKFWGFGK